MSSKQRVKAGVSSSVNKLKTILPALNPLAYDDTRINIVQGGVDSIQKIYFKKAIPKKNTKSQHSKFLNAGSAKDIRRSMVQRENRWDSRFILEQIPNLIPPEKTSPNTKRKPSEKKIPPTLAGLVDSVKVRKGMHSVKSLRGASRYYSVTREATNRPERYEEETISPTKDAASTVKESVHTESAKTLIQRRDRIYRMENIYMQKEVPTFHKNIIKKIFCDLKLNQSKNLTKFNIREFKDFFDSIDSAVMATNERQLSLKDLTDSIKSIIQNKDNIPNLKEVIQPILFEVSMLTLGTVESILRWRERLQEICQKYQILSINTNTLSYEFTSNKSYFDKILHDTQFLKESKLYPEAHYPDPFFVSYNLGQIYEDRDLVYKVRASELFLLEENINCC